MRIKYLMFLGIRLVLSVTAVMVLMIGWNVDVKAIHAIRFIGTYYIYLSIVYLIYMLIKYERRSQDNE